VGFERVCGLPWELNTGYEILKGRRAKLKGLSKGMPQDFIFRFFKKPGDSPMGGHVAQERGAGWLLGLWQTGVRWRPPLFLPKSRRFGDKNKPYTVSSPRAVQTCFGVYATSRAGQGRYRLAQVTKQNAGVKNLRDRN